MIRTMKRHFPNIIGLLVLMLAMSCSKEDGPLVTPNLALKPAQTSVSLTLTRDSVLADGISYAEFTLKVADSTYIRTNNAVTFTIGPVGKFPDGTTTLYTTVNANGKVKVYVASVAIGTATLQATVNAAGGTSASMHFIPSYPTQILVNPAVSTLADSLSSSVNVTAQLVKANAVVSAGIPVSYYDSTAGGHSIGVFLNITTSNATGQSTSTYSIQDTTYHGLVYLKCSVQKGAGKLIGFSKVLVR